MHKKIDHVPTVRRAPAVRSELAKQRRSGRSHTGETQSDSGIR
jgi:hypothetical protein